VNAADANRWRERVEWLRVWLTRGNLVALVVAVLVVGGYLRGRSDGRRKAEAEHYQAHRQRVLDTIRVIEQRLRVDTVRVRVAVAKADTSQRAFVVADSTVRAVADTSLVVPTPLVLPALHACEVALDDKDAVIREKDHMLTDALRWGDEQQQRAILAEQELETQRPSRFGFKSGLALGIGIAVAIAHGVH
jgi:hypothetical protein